MSSQEQHEVIEFALDLKRRRKAGLEDRPLRGKTLGLLFQKPSLRTRVSFEVAMYQLGGQALFLSMQEVGLGHRESIEDVARSVSGYFDGIAARVYGHEIVQELAEHARIPVINALSDLEHPCQALADVLTLREHFGTLRGLVVAYVGDGNNVAASLGLACVRAGVHFRVATPKGYELPEVVQNQIAEAAKTTGAAFVQANDPRAIAEGSHAIYTDVWTSMGQEAEREERLQAFAGFEVTRELVERSEEAVVMHCLPAHYGEEISYEASRMERSVIWMQAENRLHAQKALLALVL